ncbi:iron-sulfur cluster-binding protein [Deltaproteobacteria bacterium Smac51]|nr:iron-sulfur cluster-binding protein [Deltaproteobacteria bacterium Smac51]
MPPAANYDDVALRASWSHRSAAYIAGLGRFGLNNLLITASGCAGPLFTLFISVELEPGRPMSEELCLNKKGGQCGCCLKHCPQKAFSQGGSFDRFKCHERLLEVSGDFNYLNRLCDVCGKCSIGPCALAA